MQDMWTTRYLHPHLRLRSNTLFLHRAPRTSLLWSSFSTTCSDKRAEIAGMLLNWCLTTLLLWMPTKSGLATYPSMSSVSRTAPPSAASLGELEKNATPTAGFVFTSSLAMMIAPSSPCTHCARSDLYCSSLATGLSGAGGGERGCGGALGGPLPSSDCSMSAGVS